VAFSRVNFALRLLTDAEDNIVIYWRALLDGELPRVYKCYGKENLDFRLRCGHFFPSKI